MWRGGEGSLSQHLAQPCSLSPAGSASWPLQRPEEQARCGSGPQGCCLLGLGGGGLISAALWSTGNTRPLSQLSLVPGDEGRGTCSPTLWPGPGEMSGGHGAHPWRADGQGRTLALFA